MDGVRVRVHYRAGRLSRQQIGILFRIDSRIQFRPRAAPIRWVGPRINMAVSLRRANVPNIEGPVLEVVPKWTALREASSGDSVSGVDNIYLITHLRVAVHSIVAVT